MSRLDVIKRNEKKQKPTPTKKNETGEKKNLFNTVSPLLGHLIVKKNISTVSPIAGHFCRHCRRRFFFNTVSAIGGPFCIKIIREEEAVTVSPLVGHFSSASLPAAVPGHPPVLCHLYLAQFALFCHGRRYFYCVTFTWHTLYLLYLAGCERMHNMH